MRKANNVVRNFRLDEETLSSNAQIKAAYDRFSNAGVELSVWRGALKEAAQELRTLLEDPLKRSGKLKDGQDWVLEDDDVEGVKIIILKEPRQRGRKKSEVPTEHLSFDRKS